MTSVLPAVDGGYLPGVLNQLRDAVSALTDPQAVTTATGTRFGDSLYQQLLDALPGRKLERSGHARSVPPMWLDCADLLADIDTTVRTWQPHAGDERDPATVRRLRLLEARPWRPQDSPALQTYTAKLRAWERRIRDLLDDGERDRFLYAANSKTLAACPACAETVVYRRDSAGERVRQPALRIRGDGTTICGACQTSWGPEKALFVARLLGYEMPAGVLE